MQERDLLVSREEIEEFVGSGSGDSYWFAMILEARFGGEIMYSAGCDSFACRICGNVWGRGGMETGDWQPWWLYELNHLGKAEEIRTRHGIRKIRQPYERLTGD